MSSSSSHSHHDVKSCALREKRSSRPRFATRLAPTSLSLMRRLAARWNAQILNTWCSGMMSNVCTYVVEGPEELEQKSHYL